MENRNRRILVTRLRSDNVAHRELVPESIHFNNKYHNKRCESSHEPTRVRERQMRKFKVGHTLSVFSACFRWFIMSSIHKGIYAEPNFTKVVERMPLLQVSN